MRAEQAQGVSRIIVLAEPDPSTPNQAASPDELDPEIDLPVGKEHGDKTVKVPVLGGFSTIEITPDRLEGLMRQGVPLDLVGDIEARRRVAESTPRPESSDGAAA